MYRINLLEVGMTYFTNTFDFIPILRKAYIIMVDEVDNGIPIMAFSTQVVVINDKDNL